MMPYSNDFQNGNYPSISLSDVTGFLALPDDDDEDDKDGKPKKKKVKKEGLAALKKQKNDPNAPAPNRIPFPDMRDVDKIERAKVLKEGLRRQGRSKQPTLHFHVLH